MDVILPVERPRPDARISYAQNAEDILLDRLFRDRPGTFMDIGANHPFIDNNTYFFYLRGWRGVNVEPTRRGHALFREHRPADRNLAVAVSDVEGEMTFFEVDDADGLTGLSTLSAEVAEARRAQGYSVVEHSVPIRTVASLIDEHEIEPPDLLSIDVEGNEGRVIAGIPLERWRPKVMVVESTVPLSGVATHEGWEPTLSRHGYLFAAFNGVNRFYLRDDLRHELPLFQTPVNVLDGYFRHEVVALQNRAEEFRDTLEREQAARRFDAAQFEREREGWAWGKMHAEYIWATWEQERAGFDRERTGWAETLGRLEAALLEQQRQAATQLEAERAARQAEAAEHHAQIAALQAQLRPYHVLDRLRVVPAGFGLARRVKRKLAS